MVGLIGHIVDNSEKYPGKLGKILMRPKKKVLSEDSSLQFGLRIRKNTPHKFRKKLGKILQKTGKNIPKKKVPGGKISFLTMAATWI